MRRSSWCVLLLALGAGSPGCGEDDGAILGTGTGTGTGSGSGTATGTGSGACSPETDEELCARTGANCGDVTEVDSCGVTRTVSCGTCDEPYTCGGGGEPGRCGQEGCTPETDPELCTALGKDCDEVLATDRCGVSRDLDCGTCASDELCGGTGVTNVCGDPSTDVAWCTPTTAVPFGWSYLDNGVVRIGVNVDHGAAIGHFSLAGINVLDSNDTGRYLQQSYYGDHIGGSWNGDPWPFNPVQGGSSDEVPSDVTEFCNDGVTLYAKTIPEDWGNTGVTPCVMEEWIALLGSIAMVRFRFTYDGTWDNAPAHQEVPALFVRRDLDLLTYYEGGAPWTGAPLTRITPNRLETQGNQYVTFDEPWLAYLNADDLGVGLYKRGEDEATCYLYGDLNQNTATSYYAFLDTFALTQGLVHEYTLYAKLGDVADLRAAFQQLYEMGL